MKIKIFFLSVMISSSLLAQTGSAVKILDKKTAKIYSEAIQCSRHGKFKDAIHKYNDVLKKYPEFTEAKLRKAAANYDLGDLENALNIYNAILSMDTTVNAQVYYEAAIVSNQLKDQDLTIRYLEEYIKRDTSISEKKLNANTLLQNVKFRKESYANPKNITIRKLPPTINSFASEYLPSFTADGLSMVFTRRENHQEDLYISHYVDSSWTEAIKMSNINTSDNEGAHTLSADGNTIIFTACNRKNDYGSCDLYITTLKNGKWTQPTNMGPQINTSAWESQPSLSADGKTLYFSSKRAGGSGGSDLWKSTRLKNGQWSKAVNLGPGINTAGNEESPFIHFDELTLYFRSDGRVGMGSFDIFLTKWDTESKDWSTPVNLGYPINTESDDGALYVSLDGETAYFSSNRNTEPIGKNQFIETNFDIYSFDFPKEFKPKDVSFVKGKISDANTNLPLVSEYYAIDVATGDTLINKKTDNAGEFLFTISMGKTYAFSAEKEGYIFNSQNFNTKNKSTKTDPFLLEIKLYKVEDDNDDNTSNVLNNIFFASSSSLLLPESDFEINNLALLLKKNPEKKIKIIGHTDEIGEEKDNLTLSVNRAESVKIALVKAGIQPERIYTEGRGESEPVDSNDTEEGRKNNRRTEFLLYQ